MAVALQDGEPVVVLATFLATAEEGDRLAREPYTVAAEMMPQPGVVTAAMSASVVAGRMRQEASARRGLEGILRHLGEREYRPVTGALLVNRAGWITDLLEYSAFAPEHPAVAEGLAVRDALRSALSALGVEILELDEKSLPDVARLELGLMKVELDGKLARLGASAGKPWRKEQKLAALGAWLASARV
ncbi:MAG: hypothetical protein JOZ39_01660 [Chloroflexi bacterium]|nr:hypothetical protein [Chloroflexota bacterium]